MVTCVNEAPRCSFAELFGFVGQRDFHHPWDVPGRGLHTDGVRSDQLERNRENYCNQISYFSGCTEAMMSAPHSHFFAALTFRFLWMISLKMMWWRQSPQVAS